MQFVTNVKKNSVQLFVQYLSFYWINIKVWYIKTILHLPLIINKSCSLWHWIDNFGESPGREPFRTLSFTFLLLGLSILIQNNLIITINLFTRYAGINTVSLANNHYIDFGDKVALSTIRVLDSRNISYFGVTTKDNSTTKKNSSYENQVIRGL